MRSCLPTDNSRVYPVLKQLTSTAPIVTQIDGLLTPAEASYLVQKAHDAGFQASETQGSGGGEVSSLRTSQTAFIREGDPVVECVRRRLATVAGMAVAGLESLQATRYGTGEQFRGHHDDDAAAGSKGHQRRLQTIFAYHRRTGASPPEHAAVLLALIDCDKRMDSPSVSIPRWDGRSCGTTGVTIADATCGRTIEGKK